MRKWYPSAPGAPSLEQLRAGAGLFRDTSETLPAPRLEALSTPVPGCDQMACPVMLPRAPQQERPSARATACCRCRPSRLSACRGAVGHVRRRVHDMSTARRVGLASRRAPEPGPGPSLRERLAPPASRCRSLPEPARSLPIGTSRRRASLCSPPLCSREFGVCSGRTSGSLLRARPDPLHRWVGLALWGCVSCCTSCCRVCCRKHTPEVIARVSGRLSVMRMMPSGRLSRDQKELLSQRDPALRPLV